LLPSRIPPFGALPGIFDICRSPGVPRQQIINRNWHQQSIGPRGTATWMFR
jgi:hypothetical protein